MRKKIVIFLLVLFTVINIITAAFLFIDIQILQAPEATVKIDIIEINSDEAIIHTTIDFDNPNDFGVVTKNLEVVTTTIDGDEVAHVSIEGGSIPPHENKTFTAVAIVAFNGHSPKQLTSKITGSIGLNIFFIQKTIPITINIITSVENAIKQLTLPVIHIEADFGEITQERINLTGCIDVYNPNTFNIYIENVSVEIENETGKNVGYLTIPGGTIEARSSTKLNGTGMVKIQALNAKILTVNMSATAGVKIAGVNKSISFYADAQIKVPDIGALISKDLPTDVIIRSDWRSSLYGIIDEVLLEVHNPNKITLLARNITFSIYSVYGGEKRLISECELENGVIEAEGVTYFRGTALLPYSKLLPPIGERFIPNALLVMVRANVTILGVNQSIWLGIGGYQDLHIFI